MHGIHDLDHGLAALGIELDAPGLLVFRPDFRILHRLVVGEEHRDQAGVGRALHVVLATQRMKPRAGPADLAGDQRERDQAARVVGAVGVLRHAHAPEDDGALGASVGARDFLQCVRLDAADRGHLLRREVLDVLLPCVEAFDVGLDVLLVIQLLGHDRVQHRVKHRHVGAVLELHHLPGVAFHAIAARVHDDELGAALGRLLEEGRGDRMVLGRIGADDDDEVGILHLIEGRGHRRGTDAFEQSGDRRGVAEPRAMVDVVGPEAGAHQLLEQISLFVRALGGAEAGQRLRPVAVADFLQAAGGAVERLLPRRIAEMRIGIRGVDELVRHLRHAVLADQRLQEALLVVHVVEAEAALDAKPVRVRRTVLAGDSDDLVVLDLVGELAADAAVRADAVDRAVRLAFVDIVLVDHGRRHQRAGRAGLHAFAAGDAGRVAHRIVEIEHDLLEMAAAGHADHVVDLDLAAGADAEIALDAGVEIDRHRDMATVGLGNLDRLALGEAAGLDLLALGDFPELGVGVMRVGLIRLVGDEEFGDHAARRLGAVGLRLDLHARRRRADAARGEHALALDLDHADAAVAVRPVARPGVVAQVRHPDAEAASGAEDRLTLADVDLLVVHEECVGFLGRIVHGATFLPLVAARFASYGARAPTSGATLDRACCTVVFIITNVPAAWRVHPGNISKRTTADLARPGRGRRSRRRASGPTIRSTAPHPTGRFPSA